MKKVFSLIEITIALGILGIIVVLSGSSLLKTYELHTLSQQKLETKLQSLNALLQIKKILQDSIQPSLKIIPDEKISQNPINLKNKSLIFYPKTQELLLIGDYSLPCLHGIFNPKTLQINSTLNVEFLAIKTDFIHFLNQNCKVYHNKLYALFVTENFVFPEDFYSQKYTAEILNLNANELQTTIPKFLESTTQNLTLLPKVYFLQMPYTLDFRDKISLQTQDKTHILFENLDSFFISTNDFGILLKLCTKDANNQELCLEDFITKETL